MQKTLHFQSTISVFLLYLILKFAPITAVVYYFGNAYMALITGFILLLIILIYSGLTNHHFSLHATNLDVIPSLFFWKNKQSISYQEIQDIEIKYSTTEDNVQWVLIRSQSPTGVIRTQKYRCDWLHRQDPPELEEEAHDHPEHELFELLEDEDFYDGSLEQLCHELKAKGLPVREVV